MADDVDRPQLVRIELVQLTQHRPLSAHLPRSSGGVSPPGVVLNWNSHGAALRALFSGRVPDQIDRTSATVMVFPVSKCEDEVELDPVSF
jgi:hypothetical protein